MKCDINFKKQFSYPKIVNGLKSPVKWKKKLGLN